MSLLDPLNEERHSDLNAALELRRQAWFNLQDAEERLSKYFSEHAQTAFYKSEQAYIDAHSVYKKIEIQVDPIIPEVKFCRKGVCPDHKIKEGDWWREETIGSISGVYGGIKTNLILQESKSTLQS